MGPFEFGNHAAEYNTSSNRALLAEIYTTHKNCMSNTTFDQPADRQITCYNVGKKPSDAPTPDNFGQIDFLLMSKDWLGSLKDVTSDRRRALASHHFLVYADLDVQVPKESRQQPTPRRDLRALRLPGTSNRFAAAFADRAEELESCMPVSTASDIDALMKESFSTAATAISALTATPQRPWVSDRTMDIIKTRTDARHRRDVDTESRLNQQVKASVKRDRAEWWNIFSPLETGGKFANCERGLRLGKGGCETCTASLLIPITVKIRWLITSAACSGRRETQRPCRQPCWDPRSPWKSGPFKTGKSSRQQRR